MRGNRKASLTLVYKNQKSHFMQTSFLYQMMGLREQECTRTEYAQGGAILHIRTRKDKIHCPKCHSKDVVCSGTVVRDFKSLPMGDRPITLRMTVQRLECKHCGCVVQEEISFAKPKCQYTKRMAKYVQKLCQYMSITDVAKHLHMSWNTVKNINKEHLKRKYSKPNLNNLRIIGIDEFAVKKGHVYMTIVVDLLSGEVVYVGDGKGKDALDDFWKMLAKSKCKIEAVATDLSAAYIAAIKEHLPDAVQVFDHFHVVKLANEALDKVRIDTYKSLGPTEQPKAIKGLRWILLGNREELDSDDASQRLEKALEVNADLATAYYLKEDLRRIWHQLDKEHAEILLTNWIQQARASGVKPMMKLADTIERHANGILAFYDYSITSGKVEGINNKIKTIKRKAFGYRDNEYFKLLILAMHDITYA